MASEFQSNYSQLEDQRGSLPPASMFASSRGPVASDNSTYERPSGINIGSVCFWGFIALYRASVGEMPFESDSAFAVCPFRREREFGRPSVPSVPKHILMHSEEDLFWWFFEQKLAETSLRAFLSFFFCLASFSVAELRPLSPLIHRPFSIFLSFKRIYS